jgi:hypothetical protein
MSESDDLVTRWCLIECDAALAREKLRSRRAEGAPGVALLEAKLRVLTATADAVRARLLIDPASHGPGSLVRIGTLGVGSGRS